jgi:hypothetical protein
VSTSDETISPIMPVVQKIRGFLLIEVSVGLMQP